MSTTVRSIFLGEPARAWLPSMVIGVLIIAGAVWVIPSGSRNPLVETTVWSLLIVASFVGWGSLLRLVVAARAPLDLGLRAVWGAGVVCLLGGVLMVPALMTRSVAFVLVEVGVALCLASLVQERSAVRARLRYIWRIARREPALALVGLFVAGVVVVSYLGAISNWHTNPYDDDIAYLSFVKKLSDTGTVIEPFSFRRLSAYGSQTLFVELVSVRANPSQGYTFDHGISLLLTILLIVGHRTGGRRPSLLFLLLTVMLLVTLPVIAINTASYYSGVAFFLAMYRTLVWLDGREVAPFRAALPLALLGAAVCGLRQSYLPLPGIILVAAYGFRLRTTRGPWLSRLAELLWAGALSVAFLLPWFFTTWQSSGTFLFPILPGTFNRAISFAANGWNFVREVAFQAWVAVECLSLKTLGLFFFAAAFVRESTSRRPLWAMGIGSVLGSMALARGFTQADPQNIGRYSFGFLMAFVIAVMLTAGTARLTERPGRLHVVAGIALFATLSQLVLSRDQLWKSYYPIFHNVENLAYAAPNSRETVPPEAALYGRVQQAIPAGERVAVLADEPYYFDFARNPIWNLDMPGYASLSPGMPFFKGITELEHYFRGLGLRYFIFVEPAYSRYHYRREYFLELSMSEQELWRTYAPYLIDFLDSVVKLEERHRVLYKERGLVVLDLQESESDDKH